MSLLLTSDHQLGPMVPANLEVAAETAGELDGVLFAGDMVNVVDRGSDWFDHPNGRAFFAAFGGRAAWTAGGRTFTGAPIISSAPLYPTIGNREVIRRTASPTLDAQLEDAVPDDWDVSTYEAMFPVPASETGGPRWWARTIGDVHVVSLFGTEIWRPEQPGTRGTYSEQGDPGGLEPVLPTVAPLTGPGDVPLPFVASDEITVFTLLDSAAGTVRSYRYDTAAGGDPVLFDEFPL